MVREVLTINVGQGGIQLSNAIWKQYCAEHSIDLNGERGENFNENDLYFQTFFEDTSAGQLTPRNLSIDLEPTVIDDVRRSSMTMFHPEFLINGKEDAASNFARGMYTVGKEMMDVVKDRVRKLVDNCDNCQGFNMNHAIGGGTGSGLGANILEHLAVHYRKKPKIGFEIYPSPNISTCIVEPYNGLMGTHWLIDHTDVSMVLDNEALYSICQKKLDIKRPSYTNLNFVIAKVVSSMTAALRFDGELNVDLAEFQTNLVPFPRLHFMTSSLAPVISEAKTEHEAHECRKITDDCFQAENFLVKYPDWDVIDDKYMAISLNYRGNVKSKIANATVQWAKQNNKITFVEWCPTGFKIGLNDTSAAKVEGDGMAAAPNNAVMIANNCAISRVFSERLCKKYDMMYSQRAYVHWYVGEGMEEGEFSEAREDLGFLEKDYLDASNPPPSGGDLGEAESYEEEF